MRARTQEQLTQHVKRTSAWVLRPGRKASVTREDSEEEEKPRGGQGSEGRVPAGGLPQAQGPLGTWGRRVPWGRGDASPAVTNGSVSRRSLSHRVLCWHAEEG